jgi:hypothetical protein
MPEKMGTLWGTSNYSRDGHVIIVVADECVYVGDELRCGFAERSRSI